MKDFFLFFFDGFGSTIEDFDGFQIEGEKFSNLGGISGRRKKIVGIGSSFV